MIKFICFKWGTKYPALYVNRLYSMVNRNCDLPFKFYCITDDITDIRSEVICKDIKEYSAFKGSRLSVFTVEKASAFQSGFLNCDGPCVLLDLDILIHGNLTSYLKTCFTEFRIIKNYWQPPDATITHYGHIYCAINSSFVTWSGNQANHVFDFYKKNIEKISKIYWSLDHSMFYLLENQYSYHPEKIVYSYNGGAQWPNDIKLSEYRSDYKICLFNNSHGIGLDLSDTSGWAKEIWKSHDL